MYKVSYAKQFKKDLKRCEKRGLPMKELQIVIDLLIKDNHLPPKYRQHKLSGNFEGCWECHIKADWLLVWEEYEDELVLLLTNTGSHADIFG